MGKFSYLGRRVVIHGKSDGLARDVDYPDVVEDLWVVEWDLSGDWDTTRLFKKIIFERGNKNTLHDAEGNGEVLHWAVHVCNSEPDGGG